MQASKWTFAILSCIALFSIFFFAASSKIYPETSTYFSLLGISPEEIDKIEFYYEPLGLPEASAPRCISCLERENKQDQLRFQEVLTAFDCQLQKLPDIDWAIVQDHFQLNSVQATFYVDSTAYTLPVLDIYERKPSGPLVGTWVLTDQAQLYQITNLPGLEVNSASWPYERGLGSRLFHYAGYQTVYDAVKEQYQMDNPYSQLDRLNSPLLYMLDLPIGPLAGYADHHSLQDVFDRSSDVFAGEIIASAYTPQEAYTIRIEDSLKGNLKAGDEILFCDGKGYSPDSHSYCIRSCDSERALKEGGHYLFFMKKQPGSAASFIPTERYYGICEIINGRVFPICNTKPQTA